MTSCSIVPGHNDRHGLHPRLGIVVRDIPSPSIDSSRLSQPVNISFSIIKVGRALKITVVTSVRIHQGSASRKSVFQLFYLVLSQVNGSVRKVVHRILMYECCRHPGKREEHSDNHKNGKKHLMHSEASLVHYRDKFFQGFRCLLQTHLAKKSQPELNYWISILPVRFTAIFLLLPLEFVRVIVAAGVASPLVWKTGVLSDVAVMPEGSSLGPLKVV